MFIPDELTILILKNVKDNNTYRNCRIVCKKWNYILSCLYNFDEIGNIISKLIFEHNYIKCIDNNNKLKYEYINCNYGKSKYREYNSNNMLIKKVEVNFPKEIYFYELKNNIMNTRKINIKDNTLISNSVPILPFNPNCTIM